MLTGTSEPQQNREFLRMFGTMNRNSSLVQNPFRVIEMQTTGIMLDDAYLYFLRHHVGVSTISLSLSSFDNDQNKENNGTPERWKVDLKYLCSRINISRFNLRISINLTNSFDSWEVRDIFNYCKEELNANQVTFRVLYESGLDTVVDNWISKNRAKDDLIEKIQQYVVCNGKALEKLEFGMIKYSVNEMGVVIDSDCMSKELKGNYKYLILREDCKLYSKWDDKGSLIF
jgi:sulfatase maturation enzyme AslB (radical SAM superfamily)